MFELNAVESAIGALWIVGVTAALVAGPRQKTAGHRIALLLVAIAIPVLGSITALAITIRIFRKGRPLEADAHVAH